MNIKVIISILIGVFLGCILSYLSYRFMVLPQQTKQLKQLENIITEQNKTIEKLGSIEKYSYKWDVKNKNDIKIKNK